MFGRFAYRACKIRLLPSSVIYSQQIIQNENVSSSERSASQERVFERRFLDRKHRVTKRSASEAKMAQQPINIKNIFLREDMNTEDGTVCHERELEQKNNVKLFAKSAVLSAFHSQLDQSGDFQYSVEDWRNICFEACTENPDLQKSWDTLCMQLMHKFGYIKLATSLMNYLYEEAMPKIVTLAMYMALQSEYGGEDKEQIIISTFKKMSEISDVFDATTSKYIISGLTATSQWRAALDILETAKLTTVPGPPYYSPIIIAALRENDLNLAFQLLNELAQIGFQPKNEVILQILQNCKETDSHDLLEKYFTYIWKYNWLLTPEMAKEVELYFTGSLKEKWNCKWTSANTVRGICHGCNCNFQQIELASSDFEALQREFLERTLIGSGNNSIYMKSRPEEVERFQDFVMENAPFDVVLDALNIAFRKGDKSTAKKSLQLRRLVHHFAEEKHMKVLVIGRDHMMRWPKQDMNYIISHAKTFFTEDISHDDLFCLYATLYSGKNCLFVSSDFLRDHKFNLGLNFKDTFERWQKSRQIINFNTHINEISVQMLLVPDKNCNLYSYKMPSQYNCGPVKDEKGWHIPYDDGTSDLRHANKTVLCLRYKGKHTIKNQPTSD